MVQMLLQTPGIQLFSFRAGRRLRAPLSVPEPGHAAARRRRPGAGRAAAGRAGWSRRPPRWSPASSTHPALIQLFVQARRQDPRRRRLVPAQGRLPERTQHRAAAGEGSASASTSNGAPLLQRYLPFWLANLIDRMWAVLVSIDRDPDPAVAHAAAALRVPRPLAHLPLVRPAARRRGRGSARAPRTSCCDELARHRAARRAGHRAAQLRRRAVRAAHPHPDGRQPPARGDRSRRRRRERRAAARRHRRLRLRRHRGGARAVEGGGRDHARRPHQPPPVPAAALPGRDRGPQRAGGQRADPPRAAQGDAARQPDDPAGRGDRHRRGPAPGRAGPARRPARATRWPTTT